MGVPFFLPEITPAMRQAALDALDHEFVILGDSVERFEKAFAAYVGTDHAVSVSSGTNAIHMTLEALGIGAGDEVLTSPTSFVASSNAVIHARGTPTFADVGADANLDPEQVRGALSPATKALLPVHLHGLPAPMGEINEIAADRGIPVIEDACQAHGATYEGRMAGSLADAACFSFYTTKNLMAGGDGGMVVTNDEELAESLRSLRNSGRAPGQQYEHTSVGYTSRLNTIQAAIACAGLDELPRWLARRREVAAIYNQELAELPVSLPAQDAKRESAFHLYGINCEDRDGLQAHLRDAGIGTGIHYPIPIHLQPVYRERFGFQPGAFPAAERHAQTTLSLPMHPSLSDEQVHQVVAAIRGFFAGGGA